MQPATSVSEVVLTGIVGWSGRRRVFIGFAPAELLHRLSFADVLNEDTGRGYQRRFNPRHSLDFRNYIQKAKSATIPLTFNLRPRSDKGWRIQEGKSGCATLRIRSHGGKVFAQVDCQHRLGFLSDVSVSLPFMTFLGLSKEEEMEIFNIINSKAKGLNTSLLDFHDASLASDLAVERPELFIALHLNQNTDSPWCHQLDLGGTSTSGLLRRASLRTMQKAVKRFLGQTKILAQQSPEIAYQVVLDFWSAVSMLLQHEWTNPRRYLLNKGVGVYALMGIAADLYRESERSGRCCDRHFLVAKLSDFIGEIDWSNTGPFAGLGGQTGVKSALHLLRSSRARKTLKVVRRVQ